MSGQNCTCSFGSYCLAWASAIGSLLAGVAAMCQVFGPAAMEAIARTNSTVHAPVSYDEHWRISLAVLDRSQRRVHAIEDELAEAIGKKKQYAASFAALEQKERNLPTELAQLNQDLPEATRAATAQSARAKDSSKAADEKSAYVATLQERLIYNLNRAEKLVAQEIETEKLKYRDQLISDWAKRDQDRRRIGAIVSSRDQSEIQAFHAKYEAETIHLERNRDDRVNVAKANVRNRLLAEQRALESMNSEAVAARAMADNAESHLSQLKNRIQSISSEIANLPLLTADSRERLSVSETLVIKLETTLILSRDELRAAREKAEMAMRAAGRMPQAVAFNEMVR
jgi:vacuolar-type H+-ATPase subunit I/STV1